MLLLSYCFSGAKDVIPGVNFVIFGLEYILKACAARFYLAMIPLNRVDVVDCRLRQFRTPNVALACALPSTS